MKSKFITDLQDPSDSFGFLDTAGTEVYSNFTSRGSSFSPPAPQDVGSPPSADPVEIPSTALVSEAVQASGAQSGATTTLALTSGGITINLLFDAAAMAAPASFRAGIQQAASLLTAAISDKITVNIKIDYSGTGGGAAAGPDSGSYESYSSVRADLINNATAGDTTFNALPSGSSIQGQSNVAVWNAQLKLWGILGANDTTTDDGSATFATDINSNLLVGVALHELTHAMGRVPYGPPYGSQPDIFDFFRFTAPNNHVINGASTATAAYFSVDGGNTKLADYGQTSDPSDFLNSGIQGSNDPFNEFYGGSTIQSLSTVDKEQLDALGFHIQAPGKPDLVATSFLVNGTKISFSVQNNPTATAAAAASSTGIYLSTDSTINTADTLIATVSSPSLAVGAADNESISLLSLSLPHSVPTGTYYLGAVANASGQIAEINTANNASNAIPIVIGNDSGGSIVGHSSTATVLVGGAGQNYFDGTGGAYTMIGGPANNTYVIDNPGDVVVQNGLSVPTGWTIKGTADINGDGQLDVVATDGTNNQLWLLNSGTVSSSTNLIQTIAGRWTLMGLADVNGDGHKDAVFLYQDGSMEAAFNLNNGAGAPQFLGYYTGKAADALLPLPSHQGTDTVLSSISYTLPGGVQDLTLTGTGNINGTGNNLDNVIIGNAGNNIITAGSGFDTLTGGGGADIFVFATGHIGSPAHPDIITDFTPGTDQIDLTGIPSGTTTPGTQAFHWLGAAAFDGKPGELDTVYDATHNVTILQGDTNGDKVADFSVDLTGNLTLSTSDFTSGSVVLPLHLIGSQSNTTTLVGGPGDNYFDGTGGAYTMIGGPANNTYVIDNPGDVVVQNGLSVPTGWTIKGTADINGDGQLDVVATDGTNNQLWLLNSGTVSSSTNLIQTIAGRWTLMGLADVNGDGHKDAVFLYQDGSMEAAFNLNNGAGAPQFLGYYTGKAADALLPLPSHQGTDTVLSSISYTLPGGVQDLTLTGTGNINGTGNNLDNVIIGNAGNNIITAGSGFDTLTGGGGADIFVFATGHIGSPAHPDIITDFTPGTDQIDLTGIPSGTTTPGTQAFHWLGAAAFDGKPGELDTVYDATHNVTILQGDTNGDKVADFSVDLTGNLTLSTSDFTSGSVVLPLHLIGSQSNTTTLVGGPGDNYFDGTGGAYTMIGGPANNTYVIDNPGDVVVQNGLSVPTGWTIKGTADINGDGQLDVVATDGTNNQLWLLNSGTVSSSTNLIQTIAGRWTLMGLADVNGDGHKDAVFLYQDGSLEAAFNLNNGAGAPQFLGYYTGKAADALLPLPSHQGTDTVLSSISYTLPGGVQDLTLTGTGNINGTGNNLDNVIIGNAGNNIITAGSGFDTLTGGGGADIFVFATGHIGSPAHPDIITDFTPGTDQIDLTGIPSGTTTPGTQAFHWLGAAAFDGKPGELDTVYDATHNVTILQGDTNGDKVADFSVDLTGNLTLSTSDFTSGSVVLPLHLIGSQSNTTTLVGGPGDNYFDGTGGAYTMIGGPANNTYVIDNPGDVVVQNGLSVPTGWTIKGTADINGDGQLDVVATDGTNNQLWLLNSGTVSSSTNLIQTIAGRWTLMGLADVNGDGHKDAVFLYQDGSLEAAFNLNNGAGAPQFLGYYTGKAADALLPLPSHQGTDTVLSSISYTLPGGVQDLTLTGTGNINATGNNLDNVIIGNAGNNIITAGSGFDTLTGGGGADTFMFKPNFGKDNITDFHPGQDTIQFDHTNFATPSDVANHANDDGHGNVIISADVSHTVTLLNMTTATLQQHLSDFHIV